MGGTKKRWTILLFLSILFINASRLVYAGEISIGGYRYPSIILIPIISIVVCSIILIALFINIARKKISAVGAGRGFSFFGKAKRENKQENVYLGELKKFRKGLHEMQVEQAFNALSTITRNFFREMLDLHYEFTYDELEQELRKRNKRKELIDISKEISEMKYSGKRITKQELEALAGRIEQLVKKEQFRKEEAELKISKAIVKGRSGFFSKISQIETEKGKKKHLLELMEQEEEALKKDMEIAKNIYHRILSSYYKLPARDRREIYDKLTGFYQQVNKMLFSSFYSKKSKKQLEYFTKKLEELQKQAQGVIAKEKAVERFKLPELKPHAKVHVRHLESEIRKERAIKTEELKKLEKIEKEAQERIKSITERVIEQNILRQPVEKPEEKTTIREIKYVTPSPQAENHVARQIIHKSSEHAPAVHKAKQPEAEMKAKHEKEIKTAMHMPHKAKDKKFMHIAREEKEILQKLERLRKGYIG